MGITIFQLEKWDGNKNGLNLRQVPDNPRRILVPKTSGHPISIKRKWHNPRTERGDPIKRRLHLLKRWYYQLAGSQNWRTFHPTQLMRVKVVNREGVILPNRIQNGLNQWRTHQNEQIYQRSRRKEQTTTVNQQKKNATESGRESDFNNYASEINIRIDAEE